MFGFPITDQREETIGNWKGQVQWFERHRLELHPEYAPPYDVQLGRLGADYVARMGSPERDAPQGECQYFHKTGFNVCGEALHTWQATGVELDGQAGHSDTESLALFGFPLTGMYAARLADGSSGQVQWFERARFELRSDGSVSLGLLGSEQYHIARMVTTSPPIATATDPVVTKVLELTNAHRAEHGCAALTLDPRLMQAAQRHSEDMAFNDYFSHTGLNGSSPGDRIAATGYQFRTWAENIGAGYSSPEDAVDGWWNSEGHRSNMLNCNLHDIGIGYLYLEDDPGDIRFGYYWVQVFGTQ
jgi:uncharacterized protein YkwD